MRIIGARTLQLTRNFTSTRAQHADPQQSQRAAGVPPPFTWKDLPPPPGTTPSKGALWLGRILGMGFGAYFAVQVVGFLRNKDEKRSQQQQQQQQSQGESSGIVVPALDYRITPMTVIFSSVLGPLTEFDTRADEFVDRKEAANAAAASIATRRRTGPVPAAEAKQAEVAVTRVAAEERNVFQPQLAYLRELFRVRSLELMQRSQFNGERQVEAKRNGPPELAAAVQREVAEEMAEFQKLAQQSQHLASIVEKYELKGNVSARRMMQPTTQAIPASDS